jgi:formate hydrogenlyase subunit 6/NADH:ubiquinone oxidoreductase subunit I
MPFVKTEVDIRDDYVLEPVDPSWLKEGVKSPKHLMLDPEPCILCRACEDVCPWNCIFMLDTGIVRETVDPATGELVERAEAVFVVDDNACTRCSVCVERCPSDCLYYARLPEGTATEGGQRPMATVPLSQRAEEPA